MSNQTNVTMKFPRVLIFSFFVFSISGCIKTAVVSEDETQIATNETKIKEYVLARKLDITRATNGLYYAITKKNAAGRAPKVGEELAFHYVFSDLNGVKLDSTERLKNDPLAIPIGVGLVIEGLEQGLALLKEGESATLLIPFYLAFGNQARTNLPAYSPIRFDVEVVKIRNEDEQIEDYLKAKKILPTEKTDTGLRYVRTTAGTGAAVAKGQTIKVNYAGRVLTDKEFDKGTFEFVLGANAVVRGFDEGIAKMKIGEKATLIFPSSAGYGAAGSVDNNTRSYRILPYAPLIFNVEVVSVK